MTKITKEVLFTELSIKIAILEAKVDKLLELAMKPEQEYKGFQHEFPEKPYYRSPDSSAKPYGFDIK